MSFKLSPDNFKLLSKYVEKKAEGSTLNITILVTGAMEIKLTSTLQEEVVITLYEEREGGASFPKIAVTRRLGDEIK